MARTDELYHNCRWCRFSNDGKCLKSSEVFESTISEELYTLVEGGELSEAIQEGLTFPKMAKLERLLAGYGISQKIQKEILQAVVVELEEFTPTMVAEIHDSVSKLILNTESKLEDLELKDSESFYCKYFE
jgi:hypothetical protein